MNYKTLKSNITSEKLPRNCLCYRKCWVNILATVSGATIVVRYIILIFIRNIYAYYNLRSTNCFRLAS